ncbi:TIR domain-containing protein [bacterium]|nr:TIR domain-containing protein [bacterium]
MTEAKTQKDFFISHSGRDVMWAEWIAWQLQDGGYTVVLDKWHFEVGSNIPLEMQDAMQTCKRKIVVLSENYLGGTYTHPEWAAVFWADPQGKARKMVPIRIDDCKPDGLLAPLLQIDIRGLDAEHARAKILEELKRGVPDSEPIFPTGMQTAEPIGTKRYPGKLPEIWNISSLRNPNFTGRSELLDQLREYLVKDRTTALTALSGLGGIGKTQVALEYTYRYAGEYDVIWWVKAETEASRTADIEAFARELKLPEVGQTSDVVREAVRKWLRNAKEKWLLIFDNAPNPESLKDFLPNGGHVLITSRYQAWGGTAESLEVEKMDKDEAREFLLKRTKQKDETVADAIAEELGYLPLALEQAGAYIERTGKSLQNYLELYRSKRTELFKSGFASPTQDYKETITTTWTLSIAEATRKCRAAEDFLSLCAYFAPDDIPLDVIAEGVEFLPDELAACAKDEVKFDEAITALMDYSLVTRNENGLSIHRLVQEVARDRLTEENQKIWIVAAMKIVSTAFPDLNSIEFTWSVFDRLLIHGFLIISHCQDNQVFSIDAQSMYDSCRLYLALRSRKSDDYNIYTKVVTDLENLLGSHHKIMASVRNNIAWMLFADGNLQGAISEYRKVLEINEKVSGKDHLMVAQSLFYIGEMQKAHGSFKEAKNSFEEAIKIWTKIHGKDYLNVKTAQRNLDWLARKIKAK